MGLVAVFLGGATASHKPARMGLSTAKEAASVSWVFGFVEFVHQFAVSLLINLERSHCYSAGTPQLEEFFLRRQASLVPARMKSHISVLFDFSACPCLLA